MIKIIEKYPKLTLVLLVLIMLLPNLNNLQVTIMEARNFITAREMIVDNNWILTTFNGQPRYQKPPLPTWLTAISSLIFGAKNLFGLRLPGVIMVSIIGVFSYLISIKLTNNKLQSFINGLIVITSFYVLGIIIEAPWDIYTHAFMLIAIYFLLKSYTVKGILNIALASFFIGCSILSKGPISVYTLLLPFLISYAIVFRYDRTKIIKSIIAIFLGIIIGGWWYYYIRIADADAFIKIAERETSNWTNYNVRPFYYYWSFFVQSGIWTIPAFISLLYPYLKNKVTPKKSYKFTLFWTLISLILLSIIPEKKSRYLMPVLIPLAINCSFYIQYLITNFKKIKNKTEKISVYFNFGLIGSIGIFFFIIAYFLLKNQLSNNLPLFIFSGLLLLIIGCFIIYQLYLKNIKKVFYATIVLFIALILLLPRILINDNTSIEISKVTNNKNLVDKNMYTYGAISPELLFKYGKKISLLEKNNTVFIPNENEFAVLMTKKNQSKLSSFKKQYIIKIIDTIDLNTVSAKSKKYKNRLVSYLYLLKKKE
jgi:4-amino-4-deoxy-L-arabinose transferase-like glycosyltransferase